MAHKIFRQRCSPWRAPTPSAGVVTQTLSPEYLLPGQENRRDGVDAFPAALMCRRDGASPEQPMAEATAEQSGASGQKFAPLNPTVVGSDMQGATGAVSYSCRNKSRHRTAPGSSLIRRKKPLGNKATVSISYPRTDTAFLPGKMSTYSKNEAS